MPATLSPTAIVAKFISSMRSQDFDEALKYLARDSFEYVGPNMHFSNPEDMLAYLFGMASIQKDIVTRALFAEGEQVFAAIDYKTYYEPIGDVRVAIWVTVQHGLMTKVESFYNAAVVENMLDVSSPMAG